ncbi:MAG: protein kinase domain-containing protein, partial [Terriglobia bacterium]
MPDNSRFCLSCGANVNGPAHANDDATMAMPIAPSPPNTPRSSPRPSSSSRTGSPSSRTGTDQRFIPGMLLNGRYRIVSRLGKGGMGEVYRADDLRLDEPVALKFLPEATATDLNALARFHEEVRIARQVTHPNVCRVYDIGEVDGQPFLSMQYIDGEDLGSLLRRIGRLP